MLMSHSVLMCPPTHFDIEYEINEWMDIDNQVNRDLAASQWKKLYEIYNQQLGWDVQLIEPVKGLPDMVFTANGGLVFGGKVVLPHFRQPDRQPETEQFKKWFISAGYSDILMPRYDFEGEGDAFVWHDYLFSGYPWRSDKPAHKEVAEFLGLKPISLQLSNPRFYHLDTAITFLNDQAVAIYPGAFTEDSLKTLRGLVPQVIEATEADALAYGLNAEVHEGKVVLSEAAKDLIAKYRQMGLEVYPTPIGEFQKSGGGVKCLTLELR